MTLEELKNTRVNITINHKVNFLLESDLGDDILQELLDIQECEEMTNEELLEYIRTEWYDDTTVVSDWAEYCDVKVTIKQ